jgi:cytoskeletal protein CcmA (bactofilin family)
MFSSDSKTKMSNQATSQQNIISYDTHFVGDINSARPFRIDGSVEGNIKTTQKVVIGKEGSIKGSLEGTNLDVEGKFSGKLVLSGTLSLKSSAHIEGDVIITKLAVEPGATFNATCSMSNTKPSNNEDSKKGAKGK